MHGLPHNVRQDLTLDSAVEHLIALSASGRSICVQAGSLSASGRLQFKKTLDSAPNDPASAEQPVHIFHLGDHGGLLIRQAEFRSAHLWTFDGDDYFELTLN